MTTIVGRNVKLEVALTYSAAKTVTTLTLANPGVATSSAHGMANGTVGYWTPTGGGMPQIDGQATRVYNQATNTFETQGLDTTNFSAWVTGGTFTPVATWGTLSEMTGYNYGGGTADQLDDTKSLDIVKQTLFGTLPSDVVQIDMLSQTYSGTVLAFIESLALNQQYGVFRVTIGQDGSVRVFRGMPSRPGESMTRGQLATGSFQIAVKGFVLKGAA